LHEEETLFCGAIVAVLKQAELSVPVAEVIRKVGISEQTFYRWKKQYVGMETNDARQMKQLQEENSRLKQLVADLSLDKTMLQDVLRKVLRPSGRRPMVDRYATLTIQLAQNIGQAMAFLREAFSYPKKYRRTDTQRLTSLEANKGVSLFDTKSLAVESRLMFEEHSI
jgi:putative transposase